MSNISRGEKKITVFWTRPCRIAMGGRKVSGKWSRKMACMVAHAPLHLSERTVHMDESKFKI